jgi:hypothetical protein
MRRVVCFALLLLVWSSAVGQEQPKGKIVEEPSFLVEALNHPSQAIRLRAAELLREEKVDATPRLVDAVLTSDELPAARAAVVLLERLDQLRRVPSLEKGEQGRLQLKLTPEERELVRRLLDAVREPRAEPWRFYLAVNVLDKVEPSALADVLPELATAATSGDVMKQYAAVQAMYRLGPAAREAQHALWSLLCTPCRFRGLFVARRVLDDDALAYTDEIGVYDLLLRLEESFVIRELFILETLRRVGAASEGLTAALACLARHESQHVRLDVARQLGMLDAPGQALSADVLIGLLCEHESVLKELLSDEDTKIRDEAIALFTRLGPEAVKTVPALIRLLSDKENLLRASAARILGRIGPSAVEAVPALERSLRFERLRDSPDSEAMLEALEKIRKSDE